MLNTFAYSVVDLLIQFSLTPITENPNDLMAQITSDHIKQIE